MNFRDLIPPAKRQLFDKNGDFMWQRLIAWMAVCMLTVLMLIFYMLGCCDTAIHIIEKIWPPDQEAIVSSSDSSAESSKSSPTAFVVKVVDMHRRPLPNVVFEFIAGEPTRVITNQFGHAHFDSRAIHASATVIVHGVEVARVAQLESGRVQLTSAMVDPKNDEPSLDGAPLADAFQWAMLPLLKIEQETTAGEAATAANPGGPFRTVGGKSNGVSASSP